MSSVSNESIPKISSFEKNPPLNPKYLKVSGIALGIILIVGAILAHFLGVNSVIVLTIGLGGGAIFTVFLALILKDCKSQKSHSQSLVTQELEKQEVDLEMLADPEKTQKINDDYTHIQQDNEVIEVKNFEEFCVEKDGEIKSEEECLESIGKTFEEDEGTSVVVNENTDSEECSEKQSPVTYDPIQAESERSIFFKLSTNPESISRLIKIEVDEILKEARKPLPKMGPIAQVFFEFKNSKCSPLKDLIQRYSEEAKVLRYIFRELQKTPELFERYILWSDEQDKTLHPAYILLSRLELDDFMTHIEYFFSMGYIPPDQVFVLEHLIDRMLDIVPLKKGVSASYLYHTLISHLTTLSFISNNEVHDSNEIFKLLQGALKNIAEKKSSKEVIDCFSKCVIATISLLSDTDDCLTVEYIQQFSQIFADMGLQLIPNQKIWYKQLSKIFLDEMHQTEKGHQNEKRYGWLFQPIFIIEHQIWLETDFPKETFKTLIKSLSPKFLPFILLNYLPQNFMEEAFEILKQEISNSQYLPDEVAKMTEDFKKIYSQMDRKAGEIIPF